LKGGRESCADVARSLDTWPKTVGIEEEKRRERLGLGEWEYKNSYCE